MTCVIDWLLWIIITWLQKTQPLYNNIECHRDVQKLLKTNFVDLFSLCLHLSLPTLILPLVRFISQMLHSQCSEDDNPFFKQYKKALRRRISNWNSKVSSVVNLCCKDTLVRLVPCFGTKMSTEVISEHLILNTFLGEWEHALRPPICCLICLTMQAVMCLPISSVFHYLCKF